MSAPRFRKSSSLILNLTAMDCALRFDRERPGRPEFVVEIDNDGHRASALRRRRTWISTAGGHDIPGHLSVGNGASGNVGRRVDLVHCPARQHSAAVTITVRNPLPARGGTDAGADGRGQIVRSFRFRDPKEIERAIIADDYALIAERNPNVQSAAAALVWTGSWYEADVAVDPLNSETAEAALLGEISALSCASSAASATTCGCSRRATFRWI